MHIYLLVLLLSIHRINSHGQHGSESQHPTGEHHPHAFRKMEDYVHDKSHMQHDLKNQIDKPIDQMTPEEQNFYYFKIHDKNNDNRLDGLEVIAAMNHAHEEENGTNSGQNSTHFEHPNDEELINLVDDILKEEDLNRDGFISYEEFKIALERDAPSHG